MRYIPTRRSLLSRLKDLGDDDSWRDFFETYWKLIYSAAVKSGLSDDEAQEVVQETVLTVARKIQDFRYDPKAGSFKGWLLHTTRWRILDQVSKRKRLHSGLGAVKFETSEVLHETPDPGMNLEQLWETEWQQNLLDAAMANVKKKVQPKQYQAFELQVLKGWSAARVARALGMSTPMVYVAKHRVSKSVKLEARRLEQEMV